MKYYLSGPITGYSEGNKQEFIKAEYMAKGYGFDVVNPIYEGIGEQSWTFYIKKDIKTLLDCDGVILLPQWYISKGSRLEIYLAKKLGYELRDSTYLEIYPKWQFWFLYIIFSLIAKYRSWKYKT